MDDNQMIAAARDLEAMAELGWGPERWNDLSAKPGQLADFLSLDRPMRSYVLKVLAGEATTADNEWFAQQSNAQPVAEWMLGLPAFEAVGDDDDE
jgi:hypothetical protein